MKEFFLERCGNITLKGPKDKEEDDIYEQIKEFPRAFAENHIEERKENFKIRDVLLDKIKNKIDQHRIKNL